MNDAEEAQRWIRLKRYETPGEDYYRQFFEEFKERQRGELLRLPARQILLERAALWFQELHWSKWLAPAGAAALLAAGLLLSFRAPEASAPTALAEKGAAAASAADSFAETAVPVRDSASAGHESGSDESGEDFGLDLPRPGIPPAAAGRADGTIIPANVRSSLREL